MSIIRSYADAYSTEEFTDAIINVPNTTGLIQSMDLFKTNYTDQLSVGFDKKDDYISLLHAVNRRGGSPTRLGTYAATTHNFNLAHFKVEDMITEQDFRGQRKLGTGNDKETLDNIVAEKMISMRSQYDLTMEYMKFQALQGISTDPDGNVYANMFTEFGVSRPEVDFDLANVTDVGAKIREVIDTTQSGLKTGGVFAGELMILVSPTFFNKLVQHASVTNAYYNSSSNMRYQEAMTEFRQFGAISTFSHQGVVFVSYGYSFPTKNQDGTTTLTKAIADDEGFVVPRLAGNKLFQAWYGPSTKIGSTGGSEIFMDSYVDPKGYYMELMMETSPLFFCEKPETLVKVTTSS